jgi:hypothetical protein
VNVAKHWGVIMYILAAFAAISALLTLAAAPGVAGNLFPEPSPREVVEATAWLSLQSFGQPQGLPGCSDHSGPEIEATCVRTSVR